MGPESSEESEGGRERYETAQKYIQKHKYNFSSLTKSVLAYGTI